MNDSSEILAVITIIPCYNEEDNISWTCSSLGFGINDAKQNLQHLLVLIDNNSTDSTLSVLQKIKTNSIEGTVYIHIEKEQGYVPARHAGNEIARSIALSNGWNENSVLILQADADTFYSTGYIQEMARISLDVGENVLVEACVSYESKLIRKYRRYFDLCAEVDGRLLSRYKMDTGEEIIVDDKVAGYRLSDYFFWGGHVREYFSNGNEVYAETTRLYLRAKTKGAKKVLAENAEAKHSMRKLIADTALHFATAGFPREDLFKERFKRLNLKIDINDIESSKQSSSYEILAEFRLLHVIALFIVLPLYIRHHDNINLSMNDPLEQFIISLLPAQSEEILFTPKVYFENIFNVIDRHGDLILSKLEKHY
ncbi:MAG TPA: glycosyltransferase family A protein [Flavipsychrobacter sp.]|nr:glycosyltransferase family A protein [Flavipsychrobacter sp.]